MSFDFSKVGEQPLPSDWKNVRLGDLISLRGGLSYKGELISDDGNSLVTMGCVSPDEPFKRAGLKRYTGSFGAQHSLGVGDLVIATRDVTQNRVVIGCPAIIPSGLPGNAVIAATNLYKVINTSSVDNRFLYWVMKSPSYREQIVASAKGTTVVMLTKDAVENFTFKLPPPSEQSAIYSFLDSINDRITLLRETNATLEAIAQALFKSWFVDFDPVRAKAAGLEPQAMDAPTAALFPDSFEDSELGLVPKGWSWAALADAYEMNPSRKLKKGEVAPYLDMSSAPTCGHCSDAYIQREMGSGAKFTNGDTLLARITPCLENGKSAFVDFLGDGQNGWGSTEFLVLRPKSPLPEYHGYLLARHKAFREFAIQSMSGTSGRQRIQNDVLGRFFLAIPTESVANAFSDLVMPIQKSITANHQQAQTLTQLRDTLLPRLISGQLRLPEAEALIQEAL
ncbi:restriction endonuclease subunit S [Pseudomonas sp. N040]|uniref:restriction endonuclease subunit S n=1 Tax=Pseudomonas sp. N040 TaxID=2785325 RepID=UPI0018A2EE01|nr:restriction endonuclease subunit S [Pseudomonas sp. N040]MBF7731395.1 restriction endonuclease subunit S [Pseudomonas sp. N040]MBW7015038.1 restriction endonuclease subunit S [Pseudomonas sp. N040]